MPNEDEDEEDEADGEVRKTFQRRKMINQGITDCTMIKEVKGFHVKAFVTHAFAYTFAYIQLHIRMPFAWYFWEANAQIYTFRQK